MAIIEDGGSPQVGSALGAVGAVLAGAQAGISDQAMDQARQAAQGLKDAAGSGQIRIGENAFNDLNQALIQIEQRLGEAQRSTHRLGEAPKLGSSPYAQTVATHVQKGGIGEANSAIAVLQQVTEILQMTQDALKQAKKNYEDNEQGNVQALKK